MFPPKLSCLYEYVLIHHSLEKEPARRASPWRMLEHPWMIEMRSKRVNMAHFLSTVWAWEGKPAVAAA
jgi:mitogen-activated protein kinase kinase